MEEVKLLGVWESPFSYRVKCALKLKGIPYEYIEEDLDNKSPLLLKSNPVHKKIPVLIHGGKPICESSVILEYIEETWPQNPLLPTDPYDRAVARFWIKFFDDKVISLLNLFEATGEDQENVKDCLEMMRTIEEHAFGEKKFMGGERIGLVDIVFGGIAFWLGVIEAILGVKLLEAHSFPRLHTWVENFKEVTEIKENHPDLNEMIVFFKGYRERQLAKP